MQFKKKSAWTYSIVFLLTICIQPLSGAAHHSDAHVRHSLAQILAADKYRYDETSADTRTDGKTVFERILEKIDRWISPVKKYLRGLFRATSVFAIAIYVLILIAIISGIVFLVRRIKDTPKRITIIHHEGKSGNLDYERELIRSENLAREGRFREAIQCCIKAVWLFYHFKGNIRYRKNITNREYLALLRNQQENRMLEEIVNGGEAAIYGEGDATRDTCENIYRKAFEIFSK